MLPLLFPSLISFPDWMYIGQDAQWIAMSLVLALLMFFAVWRITKPTWGFGSLLLVFLAIWSWLRCDWRLEVAPMAWAGYAWLLAFPWLALRQRSGWLSFWCLYGCLLLWNLAFVFTRPWGAQYYWYSPFNQENHFQMVNLIAMVGLFLWRGRLNRCVSPWILVLPAILVFESSLLTGAKMVQLAWILVLSLAALRWALRRWAFRLPMWACMLGSLVLVAGLFLGSAGLVRYWPFSLDASHSIASRQVLYGAAHNLISEQPWLGVGTGGYRGQIRQYWPSVEQAAYEFRDYPLSAHNHLLHTWVELGVVGAVLVIAFWTLALAFALRRFLRHGDWSRALYFPLLLALYAMMAIDVPSQGLASAWLLSFLLPYWVLADLGGCRWNMASVSVQRGIALLTAIILCVMLFWQVRQAYADHFLQDLVKTGVLLESDVPKLEQSRRIRPNSPAYFWSAMIALKYLDLEKAQQLTDSLQMVSGYRWFVEELRANAHVQKGECAYARAAAKPLLAQRSVGSYPVLEQRLARCVEGVPGRLFAKDTTYAN